MMPARPPFESDRQRRERELQRDDDVQHRGKDLWLGVAIVLTALLGVCVLALLVWGMPAIAQALPNPPGQVLLRETMHAYTPQGVAIELPAGTFLDLCGDGTGQMLRYDLAPVVFELLGACEPRPAKCPPESIFCDNFEEPWR